MKSIKLIVKNLFKKVSHPIFEAFYPNLRLLRGSDLDFNVLRSYCEGSLIGQFAKLYTPYKITDSSIGDYTYIAGNSSISMTSIGKFCSIGPNLISGWGVHPANGISTAPMFYSTMKQNGTTYSKVNKIQERAPIIIGNDVFIGMNVTILDGVNIGDGAIIGAGAVVSKDIPPYAIAVGSPIKVIKYRFNEDQISKLLKIKWWEFDTEKLPTVESLFFEIDKFIANYE